MIQYYPTLRFKLGEYAASAKLQDEIQRHMFPRFVIPPLNEKDPELGRLLTLDDDVAYVTGTRIGKYWPLQPAFLDTRFVAQDLGERGLVRMFEVARSYNSNLIPIANYFDLNGPVYRELASKTYPRLGVHVPFDEVDANALLEGVIHAGCEPEACDIFVDFSEADLEPSRASDVISSVLDLIGGVALWRKIIFLASVFPTKVLVQHGQTVPVPRNDYKSFLSALNTVSIPQNRIGFADYGADCVISGFRVNSGGRAIRHLRYTTPNEYVIVRGKDTGTDEQSMTDVCRRVIELENFAGLDFSYADYRVFRNAKGLASCGNASMWREWNTAHHITMVVHSLGRLAGIEIGRLDVPEVMEQGVLI